jgi:hypothetical protein
MAHLSFSDSRKLPLLCGFLLFAAAPCRLTAQAPPAAAAAFHSYIGAVEERLARQHSSATSFLAPEALARLRRGGLIIEQLTPSTGDALPGALLHHWRGTAFVPGATAAGFERLLRDVNDYPHDFSPQVLQAKVLAEQGNYLRAWMRVRQRHVITVVLDTTYDVTFAQLDPQKRYSISRSTRISEMDSDDRALSPLDSHGFLWRLNTYWSYEQRDGGLYIQIESVSLTRTIPVGLRWAVGPFVESIPRESLEFTLRSACNALGHSTDQSAAF